MNKWVDSLLPTFQRVALLAESFFMDTRCHRIVFRIADGAIITMMYPTNVAIRFATSSKN